MSDPSTWLWALMSGVVSALLGWFSPRLIAALPEREPAGPEADEEPATSDTLTYAVIASSPRAPVLLATGAGALGLALGWARAGEPDIVAFVVFGVLAVAMGYVDLRRHLLPDRLTVPALLAGAVLLGLAAVVPGGDPTTSYPRAWACAGGLMLVYLLLALVYPAGLGLGDVKLAAAIGLHLGWLGWSAPVVGTVAAFMIGGVVGLLLLLTRRATRKSAIPFGPAMIAGMVAAVLWAEPVTAWYLG
jgi:leader peptidase (prepilin peptidase)/N-methyltransferase